MKGLRAWLLRILALVVVAGGAFAFWRITQVQATAVLPVATVRKGEFSVMIRCRGELKARRSAQVAAPVNVPELRIVWLAPVGSAVKAGDAIIRFDPSSAKQQLTEKQAALKQALASLEQAEAETRITSEQDRRALAEATYQLERAKLEVSKQEILSALQGEESRVDLKLAETKLTVQKANSALNEASSRARIASLTRQRDKAQAEVDLTEYRLSQMEIKAPIAGVVIYMPNYTQGWMDAKPFKIGDQVWPGAIIAEIPDLSTIEMEGKIEEIDRGRMSIGLSARVKVDALPEKSFEATLAALSPLTEMGFEWPPMRSFRGFAKIANPDAALRPGMNGSVDFIVQKLPDAISVPAKSLFSRNGRPLVYIARNGTYDPKEVKVVARNPDEVAIEGIEPGTQVALVEPGKEEAAKKGQKKQ